MRSSVMVTALLLAAETAGAAGASFAGSWRIAGISGVDSFDPAKTEMRLSGEGKFSSTVGCNRIAGEPRIDGDHVTFGALATTRMACPPALGAVEAKYLSGLNAARSFRLADSKLILVGENGEQLVVFARMK